MLNSKRNYRNTEPHQVIAKMIGISIVIIVAIWHVIFPKSFAGFITYFASTIWEASSSIEDVKPFTTRQELLDENKRLQMEIVRLSSVASSGQALAEQNADLKKALGRVGNIFTISAEVLAKPPYTLFDTLVIDRGMAHGLRDSMTVFALGSSTPIGYVLHANQDTSVVRLYSSPGEESDVFISAKSDVASSGSQNGSSTGTSSIVNATKNTANAGSNRSKSSFRAKGIGGGMFLVVAPRDIGISVGDIVTKPSAFSGYFGRVSAVELDPSQTFANVYFSLPENPKDMRWVEILQ